MNLDHRIMGSWNGSGTYLCKCGASIEASNEDKLRWGLLDHCVDQARAEVLAECTGVLSMELKRWEKKESHWDRENLAIELLERMLSDLRKLQPAASNLDELLKQARAEVLASLISRLPPLRDELDKLLCDGNLTDEKLREISEHVLTDLADRLADTIRRLNTCEPAASNLEELLRKAELKGLHYGHSQLPCEGLRDKPKHHCCNVGKHITELEKARDISEGL